MKFFLKLFVLLIVLFLGLYNSSIAQEKLVDQPLQAQIWTGYSFESVYFLGKTRNATSAIIGLGFRKAIRKYNGGAILYYTADVIPYIHFDYPKRDDNEIFTENSGFGFSPVGFVLEKKISSIFSYQLGVSGSFILIDGNFPTDAGRKLNFTFDPTFTFQTNISKSVSISTGYKFHHISNAQTGSENPGLDSNFLFLSLIIK